ncbi:MAG: sigma-54 interaction domain-containing protein [Nitrospirota bacterium]
MNKDSPWVTSLLSSILISYVESHRYDPEKRIDYREIVNTVEGFEHIKAPGTFLKDHNYWIPHIILKNLLKRCEEIMSDKEVSYHAAVAYFDASRKRIPSLLEIIARTLNDVAKVITYSHLWASAYTNYMKLQSFERGGNDKDIYIISQFNIIEPSIGNILLIRGNYEGFTRIYDFVEEVICNEEISQVRLQNILDEFGNYYIEKIGDRLLVKEKDTSHLIIEAKEVTLKRETISPKSMSICESSIIPLVNGQISLLTKEVVDNSVTGDIRDKVVIITKGGTLTNRGIPYFIKEGRIFNAPYSLYRFSWVEKERGIGNRLTNNKGERIPYLLFKHLQEVREGQKRMLGYIIENKSIQRENMVLKEEISSYISNHKIIGESRCMKELLKMIRVISETDSTVLIYGETGTGKEMAARSIHYNSRKKNGRFIAINCGAISESLLETELFGHEKGAFTGAVKRKKGKFELADGGTLFLDEIGDISQSMQVRLLRVLQEREFQRVGGNEDIKVDLKIISATNKDLIELVRNGKFRMDLYYRLNVIHINLPPLRERREDISILSKHFVNKYNIRLNKRITGVSEDALSIMERYHWPGNVRELENIIERAMTLAVNKTIITPDLLPIEIRNTNTDRLDFQDNFLIEDIINRINWDTISNVIESEGSFDSLIKRVELSFIKKAIKEHGGNKTMAAFALKRSYRWLRKVEKSLDS